MTKSSAPQTSRAEAKTEATNKAARQLIDNETTARRAKTARLRAARLAQEDATPSLPQSPVKSKKS